MPLPAEFRSFTRCAGMRLACVFRVTGDKHPQPGHEPAKEPPVEPLPPELPPYEPAPGEPVQPDAVA